MHYTMYCVFANDKMIEVVLLIVNTGLVDWQIRLNLPLSAADQFFISWMFKRKVMQVIQLFL